MIPRGPFLFVLASMIAACGADSGAVSDKRPAREGAGIRLDEQTHFAPPPFPVAEPFANPAALAGLTVLRSDRLSVAIDQAADRPGAQLKLSIRYRDIPAGAGLKLELVRDVGAGARGLFPGAVGPLEIHLTPVSGSGTRSFVWIADEVACAPSDGPMMCGPVTAGRYRILATLYERSDFLTVGWPPRPMPATLAEAHSATFRIAAPPPVAEFERPMRQVALQHARASARTVGWRDTTEHPLVVMEGGIAASRRGVCANWIARPPLTGRIRTCAPADAIGPAGLRVAAGEITARGDVGWAPGVIPYEDAVLAGLALARPPYLARMRPREGTRLQVGIAEAAFRADLGAWVIRFSMTEAGGVATLPDRLHEQVTVCVAAREPVVRIVPAGSDDQIEPGIWPGPCPA